MAADWVKNNLIIPYRSLDSNFSSLFFEQEIPEI